MVFVRMPLPPISINSPLFRGNQYILMVGAIHGIVQTTNIPPKKTTNYYSRTANKLIIDMFYNKFCINLSRFFCSNQKKSLTLQAV